MFNKGLIVLLSSGALLLAACTANNSEEQVSEKLTTKKESVVVHEELPVVELSPDEEERYISFAKDLNLEHLEGLEPKSVAKMYVQAVLDKNYNVQYALYTDREEVVQWSKEEDQSIPVSHRGTNEQNRKLFNNIDKGEFIQTSDDEGYIKYDSGEGISGFQMIKNEDGIWQVAFMPIQ